MQNESRHNITLVHRARIWRDDGGALFRQLQVPALNPASSDQLIAKKQEWLALASIRIQTLITGM
jgi:hypothetical protein